MFLSWLQTSLLFCNNVSKSLSWLLSITLSALSCTFFIILLNVLEQSIQTREQSLNWDFTIELRTNLFWESLRWFESLDKVPTFYEAFLHKFLRWILKVSLLSIVTPSNICSLLFFIESFIFCIFSKAHEMTLPSITSHEIFIKPFCNCIKISTQAIFYLF